MTLEVDTEVFYSVGRSLFDQAKNMHDAFDVNVKVLAGTGSMAGSDDAGTAWAKSYDERAAEVLGAVNDLNSAMENYGGIVIQAGYNHAVAEHDATVGNQGPPPAKPQLPQSATSPLSAPPSAGGPGEGLIDSAIGLVAQVGVPIPDGDTDKIDRAAQAWDSLATVYQTTFVPEALGVDARIFSDSKAPEDDYIARDINELRDAARAILDGCAELSQSCRDYESHLDELRDQLTGILHELEVELAVTAAVSVLASFVSFGVGAVAGTAKAAHTITKFAKIVREAVGTWKISKNISTGVKKVHDIAGVRKKLERITCLGKRDKPADSAAAASTNAATRTRQSVDDKLERYLLNPDHEVGGPKAKWFEQALGFTRENADDLAKQLVFDESKAVETATTQYGTKYNEVISITGANGKTIDVTVGWIRNNDGVVRLVTAIPTPR